MSSYQRQTIHPETGNAERAEWLDDYFGQHNYGVRFPSDGKVFRADEFDWQEDKDTLVTVGTHRGGAMTVEQTHKGSRFDHPLVEVDESEDGKKTTITRHEDGHQDVTVEVNRLNLENRTQEDTEAEAAIINRLSKEKVGVLIIHAESRDKVYFTCSLTEVRKNAEMVIGKYLEAHPELKDAGTDQFIIVESAVVNKVPTVSKL